MTIHADTHNDPKGQWPDSASDKKSSVIFWWDTPKTIVAGKSRYVFEIPDPFWDYCNESMPLGHNKVVREAFNPDPIKNQ